MPKSSKALFKSASGADKFLITHGRDERTGQKIYLPGDMFQHDGVWYDEEMHKGHVVCGDDKCRAHIQVKSPRSGSVGPRQHWATVAGETHIQPCKMSHTDYIGAQIHLKLGGIDTVIHPKARERIDAEGHYKKGKITSGAIKVSDEEMKRLEYIEAKDVDDFIDFMQTKSADYINNSVIVYRDMRIPWRFFAIYYNQSRSIKDTNIRFKRLVDAMRFEGQKYMPVFMEVVTNKDFHADKFKEKPWIISRRIPYGNSRNPEESQIVPRIFIDTHNTAVTSSFGSKGRFVILAMVELNPDKQGNDWLLDARLTNVKQIRRTSMREIVAKHEENQKIASGSAPAPMVA